MKESPMPSIKFFPLSLRAVAVATVFACITSPVSAQAPRVAADTSARVDSAAKLATIKVTANKSKSRIARERQMIVGNRLLAKQLASYDRRIEQLEARLDSLRIEAAHKWRDARAMESAAFEARERRIALERRLAVLEAAADSSKQKSILAGPR
jgi:hypothetical protein